MGCRTCHNPHAGPDAKHFARSGPGEPTYSVCTHCHADKELMKFTGHSPQKLGALGFDVDSCKPCHAMHADPKELWGQMLSPRFLAAQCETLPGEKQNCVPCLACHQQNGPAPARQIAEHPEAIMMNIVQPADPGYLPLFDPEGKEHAQGRVGCRTCHLSHGRLDLLRKRAESANITAEEQHSMRMQVRSFIPPNACTACHGADARIRYPFFHDPKRRTALANQRPPNPPAEIKASSDK
jgi:hypothetical protein